MRVPFANKPNITQTDVTNKTVTRYFVKNISTQRITEVDLAQYTALSPLPYYQSISLPWTIGGNDKDITTTGNHIKRGAESKNIAVVEYYETQMEGLRRVLRNHLEYFSGTVVTQESVYAPPVAFPVSTTTTTTTTTIPIIPLIRLELGRLFSQAALPIYTAEVEEPFSQSVWTSTGDATVVGLNAPEVGGTLAFAARGASPNDARPFYINTIPDRVDAMMFTRITNWSRTQVLALPMLRMDTPAAFFPTRAILSQTRNSTSNSFELYEFASNVTVQSSVGALATPTTFTVGLMASGSSAASWVTTAGGITRTLSGVTMQTAGRVGVTARNFSGNTTTIFFNVDRVSVHAANYLRVESNVPIRVRVLDESDSVLATQDSTGGITDINLWDIRSTYCPEVIPLATKLQILNPVTSAILTEIEPEERLWGGDVWQYTGT